MGKRPFYRKVRRTLYETVSDSGNSVLRYRGHDDKEYYVASSNDPNIGPGGGMIEVTWQELKNKRDAGELTPGCLYRITDYQCTTTQKNTKSAGHQFDIVLLALSENKLAEEGWAMEHPTDVYDVTFRGGGIKKCYVAPMNEVDGAIYYNIVDIDTLLGYTEEGPTIDEEAKTVVSSYTIDSLQQELPYNYFQNSNLSAWKVWYCLDNDKSRFAWADDSVDEDTPAIVYEHHGEPLERDSDNDVTINGVVYYAWSLKTTRFYSTSETPNVGDILYDFTGGTEMTTADEVYAFTSAYEGTGLPNGRGVIYRLIDEWNNDVPYDFKNIMLSVGTGKDAYGYLFSRSNYIGDGDYSINGAFVNVSIAQYPTYTGDKGEFINSIESGILVPLLRTGERLQDIKIASGYLTSNGQIDQLSSHSIMGYSIESSKESSKT